MTCLACQDREHDCCDNVLSPGACVCGCVRILDPEPYGAGMVVILLAKPPVRRDWPKQRTHCHRGHELTDDNVYRQNGSRTCLECRRRSWRNADYRKQRKGVA